MITRGLAALAASMAIGSCAMAQVLDYLAFLLLSHRIFFNAAVEVF